MFSPYLHPEKEGGIFTTAPPRSSVVDSQCGRRDGLQFASAFYRRLQEGCRQDSRSLASSFPFDLNNPRSILKDDCVARCQLRLGRGRREWCWCSRTMKVVKRCKGTSSNRWPSFSGTNVGPPSLKMKSERGISGR